MSLERAYDECCKVVGEMSFAAVRAKAGRAVIHGWIRRLRAVVAALVALAGEPE